MARYVPKQGDFITVNFNPQSGHEQMGRRPAFVLSKTLFNQAMGLAIVCPVTSTFRGHPFHIAVPSGSGISGYIMTEQVRSIDYRARKASFTGKGAPSLLDDVIAVVEACF
jgi:mRNA interferase MazF